MDRKCRKSNYAKKWIKPADMSLFMKQNVLLLPCGKVGKQINFGAENTNNKWRSDVIRQINLITEPDGANQGVPQADQSNQTVTKHSNHAGQPNPRQYCEVGNESGRRSIIQNRIHSLVYFHNAGMDAPIIAIGRCEKFSGKNFSTGNHTPDTFQRKRA